MNSRYINLFRFFFAYIDLISLNFNYMLLIFFMQHLADLNNREYVFFFAITNMIWLSCAYLSGIYTNDKRMNLERFSKSTLQTFLLFFFTTLLFIYYSKFIYSRLFMVLGFAGFGISLLISRVIFIYITAYINKKERFCKRIVVLGYNDLSKKLVHHFALNKQRISVEGYFEDYKNIHELSLFPILGKVKECISYAVNNNIHEIYSTISPEKNVYIYELAKIAESNFIRFRFVPDFHMFINRNIHLDFVEDIPVLSQRPEPLEDLTARMEKRIFDLIVSVLVITLILSWLVPLIAIIIKLNSTGPVFFVQLRSGKNNKVFRCFKFRTLYLNADSDSKQVTRDDIRITKLGKFLRRSNLDELPQFINVLLGDMSVVGPRPHMLKHTEEYSKVLSEYMIRHFVKPGVTGWAQVNGYRGEIKIKDQLIKRIEHDIWYLENWTIWLDIRIILKTLYVSLKGDKNAF